ncbi:sulfite exporter TauE/SafE family protein [Ensifer sp. ENS09]|uniref:sulfite exporter TauE/SafE family protein n=1 Tax=Ensifer sp. ENS09 TaxID=2769263 RepID=UPI00352C5A17
MRYAGGMLDLAPSLAVAIAATFFAAGILKGVTGMGLPTLAMGVLGTLISPLAAASLLIAPSFLTNVWQLLAGPSFHALAVRLWPMMLAVVVGTLGGSSVLAGGSTALTTGALGAALVLYAAFTLFARQLHVPAKWEPWLSPVVGAATGIVTGATGVFVIPAVPYLQALGLERDELVQALGLSFTVSTVALTAGLVWQGAFEADNLLVSGLAIAPALAGMWAGQVARNRVSPSAFRRWFLLCLLVLGAEMLVRPLL